ncbi:MAG TPA: hypothetical protein PKE55_11945 [Kiritimatiellia bacterium]|nr:hypothetical protein [Kiritimatiellia bacterium]
MSLLLGLHLAATFGMFGVIWFVQLIQYPLFDRIPPADFPAYHHTYTRRIALIVIPLMLTELATSLLLLRHDTSIPNLLGLALIALIWLSTFTLQVPCHQKLSQGYHAPTHRKLVLTNWIRTAAWTTRTFLLILLID